MPRIRTLKPEIWQDEEFAELGPRAQLLFIGLITQADDEGRLRGRASLVKSQLWPDHDGVTPSDVQTWLDELQAEKMIVQYGRPEGRERYIQIRNWERHQKVSRPTPSKFPAPGNHYPVRTFQNPESAGDSVSPPGALPEASCTDHRIVGSGIKDQEEGTSVPLSAETSDAALVFDHWVKVAAPYQLTDPTRARLTNDRRLKINARLREGRTVRDLCDSISGFVSDAFHRGENDRRTPYLDFPTIFKNAAKVDEGIRLHRGAAQVARSGRRGGIDLTGAGGAA